MLFKQETLRGIASGTITAAFRRWKRPGVVRGTKLRTSVGTIVVVSVTPTRLDAITARAARSAGHPSRAALLAELARHPGGRLYRIGLRFEGGEDPRIALREQARFATGESEVLAARIAQLGARTAEGPWALATLRLIEARPATRAATLAEQMGSETRRFKTRVRQLKELGLTESLEVGYRLSPRGRALLRRMEAKSGTI